MVTTAISYMLTCGTVNVTTPACSLKVSFNVVFSFGTGQCYGLDVTFGRQAEIDCDVFDGIIGPIVDQMNKTSAGLFG